MVINKQSNFIRKDQSYCSYKSNPGVDATSFFMAPNYYECLELISQGNSFDAQMQRRITVRLKSNEGRSNYEGPKLRINPRCRSSQPFQVKLNYNSLLMKMAEKSQEPSNRGASPDEG